VKLSVPTTIRSEPTRPIRKRKASG
jgi:hypothetical protein